MLQLSKNKKINVFPFFGKDISWWFGFSSFIFFAFCISTPFGYSLGAGVSVFLAFVSMRSWWGKVNDKSAVGLAFFFVFLGIFWNHSFDSWWAWHARYDKFLEYSLAAVCVLFASVITFPPKFIRNGLVAGCVTAFFLAAYQFYFLGRASGYTNAIRFGDIAVFLGFGCCCFAMVRNISRWERVALVTSGLLGFGASFLSLSRGGWLFFAFMPLLLCFFAQSLKNRLKIFFCFLTIGGLLIFSVFQFPAFEDRLQEVKSEVHGYVHAAQAETSIGSRLEQWTLAWNLGRDKPLTGWGDGGVEQGREFYVGQGVVTPNALTVAHAHNEVLDIWARRGGLGLVVLMAVYVVPLLIFFPTSTRINRVGSDSRSEIIALRIFGVSISVSYFVFGLTEVFFYLNIAHLFYIFSIIFLLSSIRHLERLSNRNDAAIFE